MTDLPSLISRAHLDPSDTDALRALARELVRLGFYEPTITTEQKARDFAANFKGCGEWVWDGVYQTLHHEASPGPAIPRALTVHCLPDGFSLSMEQGIYVYRTPFLSFDFGTSVVGLIREIDNSSAGAGPKASAMHYLFFYMSGDHDDASRRTAEATR